MNQSSMSKVQSNGIVSKVASMPWNMIPKQTSVGWTIASVTSVINKPMTMWGWNKPMKVVKK